MMKEIAGIKSTCITDAGRLFQSFKKTDLKKYWPSGQTPIQKFTLHVWCTFN